jgi:hypothetical protein
MENILDAIANILYIMPVFLSIPTASRHGQPTFAGDREPVPRSKGAVP